jgi:hypothetical protein
LIPDAPPESVAVYVVDAASAEVGCKVAVEPLADTDAATGEPPASRRTNVLDVTLAAATGSLNVATTSDPTATPVAPDAGDTFATVGGVVSDAVVKTTSTQ